MALFRGAGALRLLVAAMVVLALLLDSFSNVSSSAPPTDAARFLEVARSLAAFIVSSFPAVEEMRADRLFSFEATSLADAFVVIEEPPRGTPPEPVPASDILERGERLGLRGEGMMKDSTLSVGVNVLMRFRVYMTVTIARQDSGNWRSEVDEVMR